MRAREFVHVARLVLSLFRRSGGAVTGFAKQRVGVVRLIGAF